MSEEKCECDDQIMIGFHFQTLSVPNGFPHINDWSLGWSNVPKPILASVELSNCTKLICCVLFTGFTFLQSYIYKSAMAFPRYFCLIF